MSEIAPRISPVPPEEWTDATRDVFAVLGGRDAWENGPKANAIQMFANHPELATRFLNYNKHLLKNQVMPTRFREIVILRVAWRNRCEYEWVKHVDLGLEAGLDVEHIEAVKLGADAPLWSELERNALRAVDQLSQNGDIDDRTWAALSGELDTREMMELLFIIGTYTMLAWIFKATRLQLESDEDLAEAKVPL